MTSITTPAPDDRDEIGEEDIREFQDAAGRDGDAGAWRLADLALDPGPDVPEATVTAAWDACVRRIRDDRRGTVTAPAPGEAAAVAAADEAAAARTAQARGDWYVRLLSARSVLTPPRLEGPYGKQDARGVLRAHAAAGGRGQLLQVIADYDYEETPGVPSKPASVPANPYEAACERYNRASEAYPRIKAEAEAMIRAADDEFDAATANLRQYEISPGCAKPEYLPPQT